MVRHKKRAEVNAARETHYAGYKHTLWKTWNVDDHGRRTYSLHMPDSWCRRGDSTHPVWMQQPDPTDPEKKLPHPKRAVWSRLTRWMYLVANIDGENAGADPNDVDTQSSPSVRR